MCVVSCVSCECGCAFYFVWLISSSCGFSFCLHFTVCSVSELESTLQNNTENIVARINTQVLGNYHFFQTTGDNVLGLARRGAVSL